MSRRTVNRFGELKVFVKVADCGTFSDAARELGMTPSAVSRSIAGLETRLGTTLFERTTRQNELTYDGRTFYHRVVRILADIDEVERNIARGALDLQSSD